jgi:hypothetical protein
MSRRRGSATALKASEVVAALAMPHNIFPYRNMSSDFFSQPFDAPITTLFRPTTFLKSMNSGR